MPTLLELGLLSLLSTGALAHPQFPHFNPPRAGSTGVRGHHHHPVPKPSYLNATTTPQAAATGVGDSIQTPGASGVSGGSGGGSGSGAGGDSGAGGNDAACATGGTLTITETNMITVTVTPSAGAALPFQPGGPMIPYVNTTGGPVGESSAAAAPTMSMPNQLAAPATFQPDQGQQTAAAAAAAPPAASAQSAQPAAGGVQQAGSSQQGGSSAAAPVKSSPSSSSPAGPTGSSSSGGSAPGGFGGQFGNGKRGLAYDYPNPQALSAFGTNQNNISWTWDWGQAPPNGANGQPAIDTSRFMYIPTLKTSQAGNWADQAGNAIKSFGTKYLFSMNEPDNAGQTNLSPKNAVQPHKDNMNQFKGQAMIGAPSVTNGNSCNSDNSVCFGVAWVKQWLSECNGQCDFDFFNLHWYSQDSADASVFTGYISDAISELKSANNNQGKFFVSEFNPYGVSSSDITTWMKNAMDYLDGNPDVIGYSYFLADTTTSCGQCSQILCQGSPTDSSLTAAGSAYASG